MLDIEDIKKSNLIDNEIWKNIINDFLNTYINFENRNDVILFQKKIQKNYKITLSNCDLIKIYNYSEDQIKNLEIPKYFYEVVFEKPGGLVMPIIVDIKFEDGEIQRKTYPAQVWRKNDKEVRKLITSNKKITEIVLDPDKETADIDTRNNSWPKKEENTDFDKFKSRIQG